LFAFSATSDIRTELERIAAAISVEPQRGGLLANVSQAGSSAALEMLRE
jgi:hypothetical protein